MPADAMPGLPEEFTLIGSSGLPTKVNAPLSTTVLPNLSTAARAVCSRSFWTSATLDSSSLPISPGWGVITHGEAGNGTPWLTEFRASASITDGKVHRPQTSDSRFRIDSRQVSPGPKTAASAFSWASSNVRAASGLMAPNRSGRGNRSASGTFAATAWQTLGIDATVTRPMPARSAAKAASEAAPGMPSLPAMIRSLPFSPLWLARIRSGKIRPTAAGQTILTPVGSCKRFLGKPMSATVQ